MLARQLLRRVAPAAPGLCPGRRAFLVGTTPDPRDKELTEVNQEMAEFFGEGDLGRAPPLQAMGDGSAGMAPPLASAQAEGTAGRGVPPVGGGAEERDIALALSHVDGTLTHVDSTGRASMVDVAPKADTLRSATASGRVLLGAEAFRLVAHNQVKKGDVLTVAQIAGINGAKMTSSLIPLCHNILIRGVDVKLQLDPDRNAVNILATATTVGPTGVEMEALTACSVAGLTVYDMCKAVSKDIEITDIKLQKKSGGKSADYERG
mmetsp:Transcript_4584/g.15081  ORF Transcript_4584/g.15081 Transcript_4584/m.15081 type:complete len:264 (+) Transcript_4584:1401-2192(+)